MRSVRRITILFSGGLDSFVAYRKAMQNRLELQRRGEDLHIELLRVDLGQPYAYQEQHAITGLNALGWLQHPVKHLDLRDVLKRCPPVDGKDIWIPGRNLLLAVVAAMGLPDEVWVSACKGEMHPSARDKNWRFFENASSLLTQVFGGRWPGQDRPVRPIVTTPFSEFSKKDVVGYALRLGVPNGVLAATWSCLGPSSPRTLQPCGNCMVCARRKGIFAQFGFEDSVFDQDPYTSPNGRAYLVQLRESAMYLLSEGPGVVRPEKVYEPERIEEVFPNWMNEDFEPARVCS